MNSSLKKLRKQYIITMMSIVTLFLVAIFSVQYFSSKNEMDRLSENALRRALDNPESGRVPIDSIPNDFTPPDNFDPSEGFDPSDEFMEFFGDRLARTAVLVTRVSEDGTISHIRNEMFYMDSDDIDEVVNATPIVENLKSNTDKNGNYKTFKLSSYDLKYMLKEQDGNIYIVYVDESESISTLSGLLKRSILISLSIFIVMFILSLFLSKRALRPVEKAWDDQKRFVADASHELKTPLAVILSNSDMMMNSQDKNSEKNSRRLDNIKIESERMKELVQELLEVARGDLDNKDTKKENINLSELLDNELLVWDPIFFEAGKTLETEIDENINIIGDSTRLKRLISILVDNSLKYSTEGSAVIVTLKNSSDHKAHQNAELKVTNSGKPLTKEQCQKIFERFYRTDASREETPGYGLGLSIAQSIVTEHGGTISATSESTEGAGTTTFTIKL